ncbi:lytic murein transglycosylase [Microbulbifer flavimaris]|uniref:Lytic murein transglycosylase n=1 Tax=Microbulbifer flavimaris TaxID=1781068 RepID=A0ABX4I506_9GAMM|nr:MULTISPECIES: transglycosylase SLT domain-containing protein [Microbulbifer]KUJ84894.1 lytic murein transglycosylase [Microbulbifer sp. ZGT114]PCO06992.1 lytic murein transglycosylase [Microbulbifer flavimaris]
MSIDAKGFALLLSLVLSSTLPAAATSAERPDAEYAVAQREKLQSARMAIAQGDRASLARIRGELAGYPLLPYLDYWELSKKLSRLPYGEIDSFLEQYRDTAIGDWMRVKVLRELGSRQRFRAYLKYYDAGTIRRTSLRCYYADALARHGDKTEAYRLVEDLWLVGHSQAEECDPLFARWIRDGGLTDELAWRRHMLALEAGNLDLADYIAGKMSGEQASLAALARSVHRDPGQLLNHQRFLRSSPHYRKIVLHGLGRLARRSAEDALTAWRHYDAGYLFEENEREALLREIALQFARQDNLDGLRVLVQQSENFSDERTIEWLARQALRELDWAQVEFWINRLPESARNHERWLYWRARVLEEQYGDARQQEAAYLYRRAAQERSYYGFLAADTLGQNYSFVDRPAPINAKAVEEMSARPAMQRARELQAIGELYHARREWNYATRGMDHQQLLTAGKVASSWGWYHKSIRSVLAADYLDDLELRFPLAFADIVTDASRRMGQQTALDPYLIYAVARQESHFSHDAKSGAGALGLMQLLPSTARATARRAGVQLRRNWDLLSPSTNIALGSFYLSTLLNRFDNNRILAAAAYNAGPTRVAQWLKETRQQLPYDVWIETIPYHETRKYVQNVLAYSVIYAYRSGTNLPLLRENEATTRL